jgi:hypothetical protein
MGEGRTIKFNIFGRRFGIYRSKRFRIVPHVKVDRMMGDKEVFFSWLSLAGWSYPLHGPWYGRS